MIRQDVFKKIGKVPLLSAEDEVRLSKRIEKGERMLKATTSGSKPSFGGKYCQEICRPRHAFPRSHSRGQPWLDESRRKI